MIEKASLGSLGVCHSPLTFWNVSIFKKYGRSSRLLNHSNICRAPPTCKPTVLIAAVGKKLLKNGSAVKGLRTNKGESHDFYEASLRMHVITTLSNTFWEAKK